MKSWLLALLASITLASAPSFGAPVFVLNEGKLIGADGVLVGDKVLNVKFVTGTCQEVFGVCLPQHFDFRTQSEAVLASRALMEQVFVNDLVNGVNNFDAQPWLTQGCMANSSCSFLTPYGVSDWWSTGPRTLEVGFAFNSVCDQVWMGCQADGASFSNMPYYADWPYPGSSVLWARWTESNGQSVTDVPEPGSYLLVLTGLAGLAFRSRRSAMPRTP